MTGLPAIHCSNCNAIVPEGFAFCGKCGTALQSPEQNAERRQLSVVFCDLVGSTILSDSMDPEDLRDITSAYHEVCAQVIRQYDGHVAQYLGDGILIYFGYPNAHEDDARRAAQAALAILDGISSLEIALASGQAIELAVRIGIHTGAVVVGEVGGGRHRENLALGRTPNVAARIQSFAAPGNAVVSHETLSLVTGYFESEDLGSHTLKGLSEPVHMHRLIRETGAESRLQAAEQQGLSPFTGRQAELTQLKDAWQHTLNHQDASRIILLSGEAGIGKSRLVASLRQAVAETGFRTIECACSAYFANSFLHPIISAMDSSLGFTRETPVSDKWQRLLGLLTDYDLYSETGVQLLANLLSIPAPAEFSPLSFSPADQREMTLDIIRDLLAALARDNPTLFIVEDLHWSDPSTLEFLEKLSKIEATTPLLVLLTTRAGFDYQLTDHPKVSMLELERLNESACVDIIQRVAKNKQLPTAIMQLLIARSEGVPLFAEEITKSVLELDILVEHDDHYELIGRLPEDIVPATLQGSLVARLDRLVDAKPIAQLASIVGREFQVALLRDVADVAEEKLLEALGELEQAGLIYPVSSNNGQAFQFKHALIQDAAYQSLLRSSRREQHKIIALTLLNYATDDEPHNPEVVAHHFAAGGEYRRAADYWLVAGQAATAQAANHEALAHIYRALEQIAFLPESAERDQRELEANMLIATPLQATQGWASPEFERFYHRSTQLSEKLGNEQYQPTLQTHLLSLRTVGGRIREAYPLAAERLRYTTEHMSNVPAVLGMAHATLCVTQLYLGDISAAIDTGETAHSMITEENNAWAARALGLAPLSNTCSYLSEAWWMRGYPEQGERYSLEGVATSQALDHGPSIEFAVGYQAEFYQLLRDHKRILEIADESLRLAAIQRSEFWNPMISVYKGWALGGLGDLEQGIDMMVDGLARYRAAGNGITQVHLLGMIAASLVQSQRWDEALQKCAEAEQVAARTGEQYYLPEIHRTKAQIYWHNLEPEEAAQSLHTAFEMAATQGALSLTLRAAMTQVQCSDTEPAREAAETRLGEVLAEFTEGFDTPDLKDAAALLS